jgi:hypothetical protein
MRSPLYTLGILGAYLYFVKLAGPRYMKDRPAYNLKRIIAVYNITQIVMNFTLFIKVSTSLAVLKFCFSIC